MVRPLGQGLSTRDVLDPGESRPEEHATMASLVYISVCALARLPWHPRLWASRPHLMSLAEYASWHSWQHGVTATATGVRGYRPFRGGGGGRNTKQYGPSQSNVIANVTIEKWYQV